MLWFAILCGASALLPTLLTVATIHSVPMAKRDKTWHIWNVITFWVLAFVLAGILLLFKMFHN